MFESPAFHRVHPGHCITNRGPERTISFMGDERAAQPTPLPTMIRDNRITPGRDSSWKTTPMRARISGGDGRFSVKHSAAGRAVYGTCG